MLEKDDFIKKIKTFLPWDCKIDIKKNKNNLISVKKKIFSTQININPIYLNADNNILLDIIYFIKNSTNKEQKIKEIKQRLSEFYEKNKPIKKIKLNHNFKQKDIVSFFHEIIAIAKIKYSVIDFSGLSITWGRKTKSRTRSIRFGSFERKKNLIRIHPLLDNKQITDFFIKSVICHEIAHFIHYKIDPNNKSYHNKYFYDIIKKIDSEYYTSKNWEKNNKKLFFIL